MKDRRGGRRKRGEERARGRARAKEGERELRAAGGDGEHHFKLTRPRRLGLASKLIAIVQPGPGSSLAVLSAFSKDVSLCAQHLNYGQTQKSGHLNAASANVHCIRENQMWRMLE